MQESAYLDPMLVHVYDHLAVPFQFAAPAADLVKIVGMPETGMVLDLGTGTGVVAAAARAAAVDRAIIVGTDSSLEMLRHAGQHNDYLAVARVPELPFADETFNRVMVGFVVSHFENYVDGLREIVRVCKAGGRVGISAWGSIVNPAASLWSGIAGQFVPREHLTDAFRREIPWDGWFSSAENIVSALEAAGLAPVTTETRVYLVRMATSDYLKVRAGSVQGLVLRSKLTAAQWSDFTTQTAAAFAKEFGDRLEYQRDVHFGVGTKR